jgi:hypothetical protein
VQGISGSDWNNNLGAVIEIPITDIKTILKNLRIKEGGTAFLFGSDGSIVSGNNLKDVEYDRIYKKLVNSNMQLNQFLYTQAGKSYQVIYNQIGNTGLILGMYFPESQVMKPILKIRFFILVILIVAFILATFFTFYSYRSLLFPVHKLVDAMKQLNYYRFSAGSSSVVLKREAV